MESFVAHEGSLYANNNLFQFRVSGLNPNSATKPLSFFRQAMIEIAKQMGWKYVSTVAAEGEYGEKGIASFVALAKRQGICIAVSTKGR